MPLSEKKELLLYKACQNGGTISVNTASRLYSGNRGRDALQSLEMEGYLKLTGFGRFKVKKVPDTVADRYEAWKEEQKENKEEIEA